MASFENLSEFAETSDMDATTVNPGKEHISPLRGYFQNNFLHGAQYD